MTEAVLLELVKQVGSILCGTVAFIGIAMLVVVVGGVLAAVSHLGDWD